MSTRTIHNYIRLAKCQAVLEEQFSLSETLCNDAQSKVGITEALNFIKAQERRQAKEKEESKLPVAEFEEPLAILRDKLKAYVYQEYQQLYLRTEIQVRIKSAKLTRKQVRQALEWATQEHPEVRDSVLKTFFR